MTAAAPEKAARERVIASPFPVAEEPFDDQRAASTADVTVTVPGLAAPLRLHSAVLRRASSTLDALLGGRACVWADHDPATQHVTWHPCALRGTTPAALLAWLRFAYGTSVPVRGADAPTLVTLLAAMLRVGVRAPRAQRALEGAVVRAARQDPVAGARALCACRAVPECCGARACRVDVALARAVLTRANLAQHYEAVVDRGLMALPPAYLDLAQYGDAHTELAEAAVRLRYVRYHAASLSPAEQRCIVAQCDPSTLNAAEVAQIRRVLETDDDNTCANPLPPTTTTAATATTTEDDELEAKLPKTPQAKGAKQDAPKGAAKKRAPVKDEDPKTDNVVAELVHRAEKAEQERDELLTRCLLCFFSHHFFHSFL